MKIAIFSDGHSNLEALRAVIADMIVSGVDFIFCLGDIIGYGPHPKECLALTRKYVSGAVLGNHEEYILDMEWAKTEVEKPTYDALRLSLRNLDEKDIKLIQSLPRRITIEELDLCLAHGSYTGTSTEKYIEEIHEAEEELRAIPTRLCAVGHTHVPFVFQQEKGFVSLPPEPMLLDGGSKYLINVGSVGQPRDGDCRACYVMLDYSLGREKVELSMRRVAYDIEKEQKYFFLYGLPSMFAERLSDGT